MSSSAAEIKLMEEYAKAEQAKLRLIKTPPPPKKKKMNVLSKSLLPKFMILGIMPLFLFGIINLSLNAKSDVLTRQIANLETEINCEESERIRIQQELNSKCSPKVIEEFAFRNGMTKAQEHQIIFLDMSKDNDVISCNETSGKNVKESFNKLVKCFRDFFVDTFSNN